jgi:ribosomal protein S18 acetylase RimI-like enzyme
MELDSPIRIVGPVDLTSEEIGMVNRLIDRCNTIDGLDLPLEATAQDGSAGVRYCLAWDHDRLVGLLVIQGRADAEVCLAVDPDYRRRGIGRNLLARARTALRERQVPKLLLVAEEASAPGRAFVEAIGARYQNSEYRLVLDERSVPLDRAWPRAVELRPGTSADARLIAHLIATSFGDPEADVLEWVERALTLENHRFFIGSVDGVPIGNIRTNYYGTTIYVTAFGILPEHRGRGFGRQMLLRTVDRLLAEKWPRIAIEVETNNRNALGLYVSCGFKETTTYGYYRLNTLNDTEEGCSPGCS